MAAEFWCYVSKSVSLRRIYVSKSVAIRHFHVSKSVAIWYFHVSKSVDFNTKLYLPDYPATAYLIR